MHASQKLMWIVGFGSTIALIAILFWVYATPKAVVEAGGSSIAGPGKLIAPDWRVGQPVTYETLTVFPVLSSQDVDTGSFETLDAALASGDAVVTEQGEGMRRSRDGDAQAVPNYPPAERR